MFSKENQEQKRKSRKRDSLEKIDSSEEKHLRCSKARKNGNSNSKKSQNISPLAKSLPHSSKNKTNHRFEPSIFANSKSQISLHKTHANSSSNNFQTLSSIRNVSSLTNGFYEKGKMNSDIFCPATKTSLGGNLKKSKIQNIPNPCQGMGNSRAKLKEQTKKKWEREW